MTIFLVTCTYFLGEQSIFIGLVKVNGVLLGTSHETVAESEDETVAEPEDDMCIVPLRVRWLHRLVLLRPTKNRGRLLQEA